VSSNQSTRSRLCDVTVCLLLLNSCVSQWHSEKTLVLLAWGGIKSAMINGRRKRTVVLYLLISSIRQSLEQSLYRRRCRRAPALCNEKRQEQSRNCNLVKELQVDRVSYRKYVRMDRRHCQDLVEPVDTGVSVYHQTQCQVSWRYQRGREIGSRSLSISDMCMYAFTITVQSSVLLFNLYHSQPGAAPRVWKWETYLRVEVAENVPPVLMHFSIWQWNGSAYTEIELGRISLARCTINIRTLLPQIK
jgi:hypothetical protein